MEGRALDPYEQQLLAVFESCDEEQIGSLDSNGLEQLCEKLQLEEQGLELMDCLLGGSSTGKRVTFTEFRDGLLALLGEGQKGETGGRGSPEREVSPKFVFGKKKYGRRSRPESTDQDVELDGNIEESDSEIFVPVGDDNNKEIIMRSVSESSPIDEAQNPKKRKTSEDQNKNIKTCTTYPESKLSSLSREIPQGWNTPSEPGSAPPSLGHEEECLRASWERLGVGRDGFLDRSELALVCQCIGMERVAEDVVQQLFEKLDVDRDGRISFEEFLLLFRSGGSFQPQGSPSQKPNTQNRRREFTDDCQPVSFDPNCKGLVSADVIVETWEAAGVPGAGQLVRDLGFSENQQLSLGEVSAILEEELRGLEEERRHQEIPAPWTPHETLLQATLTLYQMEMKCLKSSLEHMGAERDKLRADISDANERASLLAQEVDDHHARLEESSQLQVKLLEQRHAEQVREVTEQLGQDREQMALQNQALERQVAALQDDEARARNDLTTLQTENEALDRENQNLLEQLSEARQGRAQLQEEVASMTRLQQRLSELEGSREQEQVLPLLEKVGELQAENTELRDRIDELTIEMEAMAARLSATKIKKCASVQVSEVLEEGGASGGATKRRGDSPLALPLEESSEEESPRLGKVRRCCGASCREETLDAVNMEGLQIHPLAHGESGVEADLEVDESESLYAEPSFRQAGEGQSHCCGEWSTSEACGLSCEEKREVARLRQRISKLEQDLKQQSDKLSVS